MELIGIIIGYLLGCVVSYLLFKTCIKVINKLRTDDDLISYTIQDIIYFSAFSWIGACTLLGFLIKYISILIKKKDDR